MFLSGGGSATVTTKLSGDFGAVADGIALLPLSGHIDHPEQALACPCDPTTQCTCQPFIPTPDLAQVLPDALTLTTIRASFTTTQAGEFSGPLALQATLWSESNGSGTSRPTALACGVFLPTVVAVGTTVTCVGNVPTSLTAQDRALIVVSATSASVQAVELTSTVGVSG